METYDWKNWTQNKWDEMYKSLKTSGVQVPENYKNWSGDQWNMFYEKTFHPINEGVSFPEKMNISLYSKRMKNFVKKYHDKHVDKISPDFHPNIEVPFNGKKNLYAYYLGLENGKWFYFHLMKNIIIFMVIFYMLTLLVLYLLNNDAFVKIKDGKKVTDWNKVFSFKIFGISLIIGIVVSVIYTYGRDNNSMLGIHPINNWSGYFGWKFE